MNRKLTLFAVVAILTAAAHTAPLLATPGSGFTGSTLSFGRFTEINLQTHTLPAVIWQSRLMTQGLSDLYVQSNVWQPGGVTGWHSHAGPSLVTVTAGVITAYEGDDPSCTPHVYTVGMGFVDVVNGHVHNIRNEGQVEARAIAVQLIPAGAVRRIDAPAPGNCTF